MESSKKRPADDAPRDSRDSSSFTGKVAIVTGSSRGIGESIARKLSVRDYFVPSVFTNSCVYCRTLVFTWWSTAHRP